MGNLSKVKLVVNLFSPLFFFFHQSCDEDKIVVNLSLIGLFYTQVLASMRCHVVNKKTQSHSFEPSDPVCLLCLLDKKCFSFSYNHPLEDIDIISVAQSTTCRYAVGDRLSPEHQRTILQRLLPYHPEYDKKIGPGVDHITVCHPIPLCFTYRSACILFSHVTSFPVHFGSFLFWVYLLSECG